MRKPPPNGETAAGTGTHSRRRCTPPPLFGGVLPGHAPHYTPTPHTNRGTARGTARATADATADVGARARAGVGG